MRVALSWGVALKPCDAQKSHLAFQSVRLQYAPSLRLALIGRGWLREALPRQTHCLLCFPSNLLCPLLTPGLDWSLLDVWHLDLLV